MAENEEDMVMDEEDESGSMNQDDIAKMIEEMEQAKQDASASGDSSGDESGVSDSESNDQIDAVGGDEINFLSQDEGRTDNTQKCQ